MALPSTGELSFSAIRTELGLSGVLDLNDSRVRGLAGKASGAISFSDLRGKGNIVSGSFSGSLPTVNELNRVHLINGNKSIDIISTTAKIKTLTASLSWSALWGQIMELRTAPSLLFEVVRRSDSAVLSSIKTNIPNPPPATSSGTLTINFSTDTPVAVYLRATYTSGLGMYYNQPRPIQMVSNGIVSGSCTYQP